MIWIIIHLNCIVSINTVVVLHSNIDHFFSNLLSTVIGKIKHEEASISMKVLLVLILVWLLRRFYCEFGVSPFEVFIGSWQPFLGITELHKPDSIPLLHGVQNTPQELNPLIRPFQITLVHSMFLQKRYVDVLLSAYPDFKIPCRKD